VKFNSYECYSFLTVLATTYSDADKEDSYILGERQIYVVSNNWRNCVGSTRQIFLKKKW